MMLSPTSRHTIVWCRPQQLSHSEHNPTYTQAAAPPQKISNNWASIIMKNVLLRAASYSLVQICDHLQSGKNGGGMLLRNVYKFTPDCTASRPEWQ